MTDFVPTMVGDPSTPMLDRYWHQLAIALSWGDNSTDRRRSALLPPEVCRLIISECNVELARQLVMEPPMGRAKADELGKLLVGAFPHAKPDQPDIYARALRMALAEHSTAAGNAAVRCLIQTQRFLPAVAEVIDACDQAASLRLSRFTVARHAAKLMLIEHEQRRLEAAIASEAAQPDSAARIVDACTRARAILLAGELALTERVTQTACDHIVKPSSDPASNIVSRETVS